MLIEFSVKNYRSFCEKASLSFVAAPLTSKDKSLDDNTVFEAQPSLKLVTSAALYGANASGKSNLVMALRFMRSFVLNSSKDSQADDPIPYDPFKLSQGGPKEPTLFEVVFVVNARTLRYGFEVNAKEVVSEWLYQFTSARESRLFQRSGAVFELGQHFGEGKGIGGKTRTNALFLSVVAQFNGALAKEILAWFRNIGVSLGLAESGELYTRQMLEDERYRSSVVDLIKKLDLGIADVQLEQVGQPEQSGRAIADARARYLSEALEQAMHPEKQVLLKTLHRKSAPGGEIEFETFDVASQESAGTQKLIGLAGYLVDILQHGKIFVIDELDARLHPLITRSIIQLFNSRQLNPKHAQLLFTTHDINLLSNKIFRRDQIWFTEKNESGCTHLHSLAEYKIRNDASFEKDYITGKYGAIPVVGDLVHLIGEGDA